MPRTLLLETSSRSTAYALAEGSRIVAAAHPASSRSTATCGIEVDRLLREAGWTAKDVETIGFSAGPGAFTGTRVAASFVKAFAFGTDAQVAAVPTPEVIVNNLPRDAAPAAVVVDARRKMAWIQPFAVTHDGWQATAAGRLVDPGDWAARHGRGVTVIGEGVAYHRDALDQGGIIVGDPDLAVPRVEVLVRLVADRVASGDLVQAESVLPVYVRRPEAEEQRLARAASP